MVSQCKNIVVMSRKLPRAPSSAHYYTTRVTLVCYRKTTVIKFTARVEQQASLETTSVTADDWSAVASSPQLTAPPVSIKF